MAAEYFSAHALILASGTAAYRVTLFATLQLPLMALSFCQKGFSLIEIIRGKSRHLTLRSQLHRQIQTKLPLRVVKFGVVQSRVVQSRGVPWKFRRRSLQAQTSAYFKRAKPTHP